MKTKIHSQSGFLGSLSLIALLFCVAAFFITTAIPTTSGLGFFHAEDPAKVSQRTLTFADRVAYQRAIEEVYWQHRIWPEANAGPKPPLDKVMSHAQIEKKVEDYLRDSQALEDYWQKPITPDQLQAEMERIASHTKQPEVLREIFAALGNNPFVIAECLARPALANRLLTSCYAYDQRFHGELRQRAKADLQAHPVIEQMNQTSGTYSEIEFIKSDGLQEENSREARHSVRLNNREWDETVQKLGAMFSSGHPADVGVPSAKDARITQIKTGVLSALQEDETSYYAMAVLSKTERRLKIATVRWLKEPLESWLTRAENQMPGAIAAPTAIYALPKIAAGGCTDDTWTPTAFPPDGRYRHTAVWTGSEMIIWGGNVHFGVISEIPTNTGARYNPSTDNWTPTSTTNAPSARNSHTAVWTGSEMIIWGGLSDFLGPLNTGGRYDPATDSWTVTSTTNAPDPRYAHTAVWTGSEMIVWGGLTGAAFLNTGGRYNPATDSWTATSTTNAPSARDNHTAVLAGSEMIIWGGLDLVQVLNTGGRYDLNTDSWTATSTINAPSARFYHTAVWTSTEMIVWGGFSSFNPVVGGSINTGGRYNPSTDSWTATSATNPPDARASHTAVWTGSEMIVWGGLTDPQIDLNTGGRYNPGTDSWTVTSTTNAPSARDSHTAVWTGSEMIVWGGFGLLNTGGRYNPTLDSWIATGNNNTPSPRDSHTAVWTGSEMIIWGGFNLDNTGGRYNPSTDSWTPTSTTNAPSARYSHTAVWTGSEMVVWGGVDILGNNVNTGGRYNPGADNWTATSTNNAPDPREVHTAVWTGSEMIVWGGFGGTDFLKTGGRYNPGTDTWTATRTTNAPAARQSHTAVWTGTEMIVWGGNPLLGLNTGGRYNPGTDSWVATSTANAPAARVYHTAVWTGSEMIIWGGAAFFQLLNTGGRYDPGTDSWTATSTTNAPDPRAFHTAIWTGSEMVVWGGFFDTNTGGRYNPGADSWTPTSTTNAPTARENQTAVWTGSEMIVWGGFSYPDYFDTGGRYCAAAPSPTPTPGGCVFGQGYWKNHPEAWPVTELQLGNVTYTHDQLLAILHEPIRGNGLLILAHQEIAAKLNIANGADGSCIEQTLADADALIGDLVVPPVGDGYLHPQGVSGLSDTLDDYNEGRLCAAACGEGSPIPAPTPRHPPVLPRH